jgi:hypothetical protein
MLQNVTAAGPAFTHRSVILSSEPPRKGFTPAFAQSAPTVLEKQRPLAHVAFSCRRRRASIPDQYMSSNVAV